MDRDIPFNLHSFLQILLPPLVGYYVLAILVCIPETLKTRLSVLGPVLYLAYQAAVTLDLAGNREHLVYLNQGLVVCRIPSLHVISTEKL